MTTETPDLMCMELFAARLIGDPFVGIVDQGGLKSLALFVRQDDINRIAAEEGVEAHAKQLSTIGDLIIELQAVRSTGINTFRVILPSETFRTGWQALTKTTE